MGGTESEVVAGNVVDAIVSIGNLNSNNVDYATIPPGGFPKLNFHVYIP